MQSSSRPPFFLTRQTANVMEDLTDLLKQAGAVCYLYGAKGVGKTRFLDEFLIARLNHNGAILIQFNANGCFRLVGELGHSLQQQNFTQQILISLPKHKVLIVDQAENAPPKVLQQILKLWSAHASENDQKLILCGDRDMLPELVESAENFQLIINSVELKPLSLHGQIEYIRFRCCSGLRRYPVFTAQQKKMLKQSQGLFSQLDLMLLDNIQCEERPTVSRRKFSAYLFIGLSFLTVLVVTAYWYKPFYKLDDDAVDNQQLSLQEKTGKIESVKPNTPDTVESEASNEVLLQSKPEQIGRDEMALESADPQHNKRLASRMVEKNETILSLFQQRLEATKTWLASSANSTASIQIMTFGLSADSEQSLNEYFNKLELNGVNLEQIMIFSYRKKDRRMMGVLYGVYSNRVIARSKIDQLPDILKVNNPIPRTVKGIKGEINKQGVL